MFWVVNTFVNALIFSLAISLMGIDRAYAADEVQKVVPENVTPSVESTETSKAENVSTIKFDAEEYHLVEPSVAVSPTGKRRVYLRTGDDENSYRKMIALTVQTGTIDADELAQSVIDQVRAGHPNSYVKEIAMTPEVATVLFIRAENKDVEFNLWHCRKTKTELPGVQFSFRNKAPYETQRKFKAEQDKNYKTWLAEVETLGLSVEKYLAAPALLKEPAAAQKVAPKNTVAQAKTKNWFQRIGRP